jgi:hypothetical protein
MKKTLPITAALVGVSALLAACATLPEPSATPVEVVASPWALQSLPVVSTSLSPVAGWQHQAFPGKAKTEFTYTRKDGRHAVSARATSSASMLRTHVRIEPAELGTLRFSWRVPQLIADADMALREMDDSPVRVVLVFEGDRSRFSAKDAMLSELVHAVTGEKLPYATLMYVWCNKREPGSVITSARTGRIRKMVVESGERQLNHWLDYERDVAADYRKAFGEQPGALVGIGVMSDTDNTGSTTTAWYGPVQFSSGAAKLKPQ